MRVTFDEWLQHLSDEDEAWAIKEHGTLYDAYIAELSDYEDFMYDKYRDDKLWEELKDED